MATESIPYKNLKRRARREYKAKEEKTEFERDLKLFLKQQELTNYLLITNLMILLGFFVRFVVGVFL